MNLHQRSLRQIVIGHRGASAYAPENTLPAYELALGQGADCVELDLQLTRDSVLVCLHDRTLERTTNVREVFPDRGRDVAIDGKSERRWFVHDLTLAELTQLDAGSWFGAEFSSSRIPTYDEVLTWVGDRAMLLVELKDPEVYNTFDVDLLGAFAELHRTRGLQHTRTGEAVVTMQSFDEPTVRRAAALFDGRVPLVLLMEPADAHRWSERASIDALANVVIGIGPGKAMIETRPDLVRWAHDAGLRVTPWTFRATEPGRFGTVRAEMTHYLSVLDVDGVITDNPDQCPPRDAPPSRTTASTTTPAQPG